MVTEFFQVNWLAKTESSTTEKDVWRSTCKYMGCQPPWGGGWYCVPFYRFSLSSHFGITDFFLNLFFQMTETTFRPFIVFHKYLKIKGGPFWENWVWNFFFLVFSMCVPYGAGFFPSGMYNLSGDKIPDQNVCLKCEQLFCLLDMATEFFQVNWLAKTESSTTDRDLWRSTCKYTGSQPLWGGAWYCVPFMDFPGFCMSACFVMQAFLISDQLIKLPYLKVSGENQGLRWGSLDICQLV